MPDVTRTYRMSARATATDRTRQRILDAARNRFLSASYDDVTLAAIASDAEVTQQTVLNHFASKEGLFGVLVELMTDEVDDRRGRARPGDVVSAIRVLLDEYEEIGDTVVRFLTMEDRLPILKAVVEQGRRKHQEWLEHVFGAQLPTDSRGRKRTVRAMYAATDVYVWKLLRRDLGTSRPETAQIMRRLLVGAMVA